MVTPVLDVVYLHSDAVNLGHVLPLGSRTGSYGRRVETSESVAVSASPCSALAVGWVRSASTDEVAVLIKPLRFDGGGPEVTSTFALGRGSVIG